MKKYKFLPIILFILLFSGCEEKIELVKIKTQFGDMLIYLYDETPKHKANFMKLARSGFYNGTTFHRIIQQFMVQGGDPNSKDTNPLNDGEGGPEFTNEAGTYPDPENKNIYAIDAEIRPDIFHKKGVIAAARTGDQINPEKRSSGSQFYVVHGRVYKEFELNDLEKRKGIKLTDEQRKIYTTLGGTPFLDGSYTVFGEVVDGINIIDSIAKQRKDARDRPISDIKMTMEIVEVRPRALARKYGFKVPKVQAK